ncbi:MAG: DUF427 domain-containing protein [Limimaricola sp.]|uniref:DUF427 domain-containing protein n=1 Tax=Limimaricola sp. TaxID=2211665 RepID=UPI001DDD4344|nr:DUF427 domain-containing protein [Limimaricola sp.]MBI1417036.1 DUF427 domain-containing protein [Limimaricola sp.]
MEALPVETVQDYPRPPRLDRVPQELRVEAAERVLARTRAGWRVCETHHAPTYYFPPGDVLPGVLMPSRRRSFCEWKGRAVYFDLDRGDRVVRDAAWAYPEPTAGFLPIAGHVAIYAWAVDAAWVGETRVDPQPGNFYGGWVTPNLRGRIKGAPGTEFW